MPSVNVLTAEKTLELLKNGFVAAEITDDRHLLLTTREGEVVNAGLLDVSNRYDPTLMRIPHEITPDRVFADEVVTKLELPSHTGTLQSTHPSIVYAEGGWNGYAYWLAHTPYPNSNDEHEDPCVVASNDPYNFETPPGLTNPIDDAPGKSAGGYNADVELKFGIDNNLHLLWKKHTTDIEDSIMYSMSTNGHEWSDPVPVLTGPIGFCTSPTVEFYKGQWYMWSVDNEGGAKILQRRTSPDLEGPWSAPLDCTADWPPDRVPWHLQVIRFGSKWIGVMNDCDAGTNGANGDLYFMTSIDGLDWVLGSSPIMPRERADYVRLYRASILPMWRDGLLGFDMYYGVVTAGGKWFVYHNRLDMVTDANIAYGTWATNASDSNGLTDESVKFYARWKDGVCTVHIDGKHSGGSLTATKVLGTLPTVVPAPQYIAEVQISPITTDYPGGIQVWVPPGSREVRYVGPGDTRIISRFVYHY